MENKNINFGFGVSIEVIDGESARIHNLKSHGDDVRNLGVRLYE